MEKNTELPLHRVRYFGQCHILSEKQNFETKFENPLEKIQNVGLVSYAPVPRVVAHTGVEGLGSRV